VARSSTVTGQRLLVGVVVGCVVAVAGCSSTPSSTSSPTSTPTGSSASATGSGTSSTPTSTPSTTATAATTTTLVISLAGCEGCKVFAGQDGTKTQPLATPWQVSGTVGSGRVTLTVPTRRTTGMHFAVTCGGDICNSNNAQPVVVLRYRDFPVGAIVEDGAAEQQTEASGCWAGTTSSTVRLHLSMTVFPDVIALRHAHSILVWASPQVAVVPGTWEATYHGGLGTQSEVLC
jgi:hypothetical protein